MIYGYAALWSMRVHGSPAPCSSKRMPVARLGFAALPIGMCFLVVHVTPKEFVSAKLELAAGACGAQAHAA